VGKLAVIGPTGCRYLDDARQANYVKDGWNYPGDAFVQDEDGYFLLPGARRRHDHHLRLQRGRAGGGRRLLRHPAVAECGVIGKPDDERGMIVKAVLRAQARARGRRGHGQDAAGPRQGHHRAVQIPARSGVRHQLPRTETGKLQRFRLRQPHDAFTFLQPPGWAPAKGYANGVAARGTLVFVGGQIGWNAQQQFETDDFIEQTRQTLRNVVAVLKEAGAGPEHMVRMTWYVTPG
jgi:acyl-coenzyme A synthetase/AMP-(fatty) acid ligase